MAQGLPRGRWVKGQSGNPKGAPKKKQSFTFIIEQQARIKDAEIDGKLVARKKALAHMLWKLALAGDFVAAKYLYDRVDGCPSQRMENININVPRIVEVDLTGDSDDEGQADDPADCGDPSVVASSDKIPDS